jgi:plastocyanin
LRLRISRLVPVGILLALALVGLSGYALASGYVVSLTQNGPSPNTFTATLGDTVTFVNNDYNIHTVVDNATGLQSPALAPGDAYPWVLTTSGRLSYRQEGKPGGSGVIVVARTGSVTLKASKRSVAYHSGSLLSGTSSFPTYPVKIEQRSKGDNRWSDTATLTPAADGSFLLPVLPERSVQYRANVFSGELLSTPVAVDVRPILTLSARRRSAPGGSLLTFTARAVPAEAANSIELARFDSQRQTWRRVLTRGTGTGSVVFRWRVEYGRSLLRAQVTKHGLVIGYAEASSRSVLVTGTGTAPSKNRSGRRRKHR